MQVPPMPIGRNGSVDRYSASGLGIYVHFPWCLTKCPYCDFHSIPLQKSGDGSANGLRAARASLPHHEYATAVVNELRTRVAQAWGSRDRPPLLSVFFGGGTPSLWAPDALGQVIDAVHDTFDTKGTEVTVECNPTSVDEAHFERLVAVGVNRVSVGVQALDDERLAFLGRLHRSGQGLAALRAARAAGVPRVSADLIFGVYRQPPERAVRDALQVVETGVGHVSAYALTIEEKTRFGVLHQKSRLPLLDEDQVADSYEAVSEALQKNGFEHYEISNYARPDQHSVHNLGYWMGRDYLGLGCGAFGTVALADARVRYKNRLSSEGYMKLWTTDPLPRNPYLEDLEEREEITPEISLDEALLLGLRTRRGICIEEIARLRGASGLRPDQVGVLEKFQQDGTLLEEDSRLRLAPEKWLLADHVLRSLM